jgi:RNA polymerase sigma-B factor
VVVSPLVASELASVDELHERYARTRDRSLRDALVRHHSRLARALATRFGPRSGQTPDDVLQVAYVGLVKAVDGFDPDRGFQFSSYATQTILGELKRSVRDTSWIVRPSRSVHDLFLAVEPCVDELTQSLGRVPTISEIADSMGLDEDRVRIAREASVRRVSRSLDRPAPGQEQPLSEALGGDDSAYSRVDNRAVVTRLLSDLSDEERLILRLRFVEEQSQRRIAAEIGSSQMHVSRVLANLRLRLRKKLSDWR